MKKAKRKARKVKMVVPVFYPSFEEVLRCLKRAIDGLNEDSQILDFTFMLSDLSISYEGGNTISLKATENIK